MDDNSEGAHQRVKVTGRVRHRLCTVQWTCGSITRKAPFQPEYLQNHSQADMFMLQFLNAKAKALPQMDGHHCRLLVGEKGDRVTVATYVSIRLTFSLGDYPAGSVGCRLTKCAADIRMKKNNRPPWSTSTIMLG